MECGVICYLIFERLQGVQTVHGLTIFFKFRTFLISEGTEALQLIQVILESTQDTHVTSFNIYCKTALPSIV